LRSLLPALLFSVLFVSAGCGRQATPAPATDAAGTCADCHSSTAAAFSASAHGRAGLSCSGCHAGVDEHLKDRKSRPATDWRGESCAACHEKEYKEWQASPHNEIPLELLPRDPRIGECMKCHQARGFAAVIASGRDFKETWAPPPQSEPEPVTCAACHSQHSGTHSSLLRLPGPELCATCHGGKWQNLVLTGSGGHLYAGFDWSGEHPHNSGNRCITCHVGRTPGTLQAGGHTFRMRASEGERPNTGLCVSCHGETDGDGRL